VVERNLVLDHDLTGIGIVLLDDEGVEGGIFWPSGNSIRDNVVEESGLADLAVVDQEDAGNCFGGNEHTRTAPAELETLMPCEGTGEGDRTDGALDITSLATTDDKPESADYTTMPEPEPQENMPDAVSAPWDAAGDPPPVDIAAIEVPARP
jgi:hypothetical protein